MRDLWARMPLWVRSGHMRWYVLGVVCVVMGLTMLWTLWPSDGRDPIRERRYRDATACLLTDAGGVAGRDAAPMWAGMQDASLQGLVKVQFLAVRGEQTQHNAELFLASLAQGGCDVVLAAGDLPRRAVVAQAGRFPAVRFVVVGGDVSNANVSTVPALSTAEVRAGVRDVVVRALGA